MAAQAPASSDAHCDALNVVYGPGSENKVADANVLVVGAGGVGCELLKNLASVGFTRITVIDLDTIDFSNLNRQFLFRRHHVGKSKAETAAASVHAMFPRTTITPLMANVKEPRFNVAFYSAFTLVCNALDNLEARRHVNRMCLAASVPLVESGSTGYNGQCVVIGEGAECYDCLPRDPPKSHAVCSIRSTPEQPVHCIVWAKALFELIFGEPDEANVLRDLDAAPTAPDAAPSGDTPPNGPSENGTPETAATNGTDDKPAEDAVPAPKEGDQDGAGAKTPASPPTPPRKRPKRVRFLDTDTPSSFSKRVCDRVFFEEIQEQAALKDRWTTRAAPTPIDANALADKEGPLEMSAVNVLAQEVWPEAYCARVMRTVLEHLVTKRKNEVGKLGFDKDDDDALAFVAAASNLRAASYGVKLSSPFATKGIAGNIVHAIATTNAMVGGLIVLEALKITASGGKLDACVSTFVTAAPGGSRVRRLLTAERLRPPNKKCFVCQKGQLVLSVDVSKMLLRDLVKKVAQGELGVVHPTINVTTGDYNNTVYECGVGLEDDEIAEYEANLKKILNKARIEDGSQLMVEDLEQRFSVILHVRHLAGLGDADSNEQFKLSGNVDKEKAGGGGASKANGGSNLTVPGTGVNDANVVVDIDDDAVEVAVTTKANAGSTADSEPANAQLPAMEPSGTQPSDAQPAKQRAVGGESTKPQATSAEPAAMEKAAVEVVEVVDASVEKKSETPDPELGRKRDAAAVCEPEGESGPEAKKQRAGN